LESNPSGGIFTRDSVASERLHLLPSVTSGFDASSGSGEGGERVVGKESAKWGVSGPGTRKKTSKAVRHTFELPRGIHNPLLRGEWQPSCFEKGRAPPGTERNSNAAEFEGEAGIRVWGVKTRDNNRGNRDEPTRISGRYPFPKVGM